MIKYYKYISPNSFFFKPLRKFASYDPYYILGVDKTQDFD